MPDAVVVGSGPNGLAAALTLARAGLSVEVLEGDATPGGGCRTEELTLPGFAHDTCSAVHPLLAASPFFAQAQLPGLELVRTPVALAHPLDGGRAARIAGDVRETAAELGGDAQAYERLLGPLVARRQQLVPALLAPLIAAPAHPLALLRFGLPGLLPAGVLARRFRDAPARALLAGLAAHSTRPLGAPGTGAYALLLGMLAHAVGWPVVRGGSGRITAALIAALQSQGAAQVQTGNWVRDLAELPRARLTLLDMTPRGLLSLAGERIPRARRQTLRRFRYGPGVCKVDWALAAPVPWAAAACRESATVHVGGSFEEIADSESQVAHGRHPQQPFCIVAQQSLADPTRAPQGQHTLYAYCHVPAGSSIDMTERIEAQIERFAPGFRALVLARSVMTAADLERRNPNCVGGDINGGAATLLQTVMRPRFSPRPYATPLAGVYLCSASTPPGGGVHGMCGYSAARAALRDIARE